MRWFVLLLLLVNVAFFAWRWQPDMQNQAGAPAASGGARLLLLSEVKHPTPLEDEQEQENDPRLLPDSGGIAVAETEVRSTTQSKPQSSPGSETASAAGDKPESAGKPAHKSARKSPQKSSQKSSQKSPGKTASAASRAQPVASNADQDARCYRLGPFKKRAQARNVAGVLAERGVVARITSENSEHHIGWWIYVPPQASRAEAIQITGQLKLHGIKDFRIIPNGPKENAISLGVYSTIDGARRVRARLDWMKEAPEIEKYYREETQYWLDYTSGGPAPIDQARLATISDIGQPGIIAGPCR